MKALASHKACQADQDGDADLDAALLSPLHHL
jgi:hypothetical protein